jgi:hypothetical protein
MPEASALRASHPLQDPYSIRQLTPLPHRTAIGPAHRRLPKPSSRFQEPDAQNTCRMTDTALEHLNNNLTNMPIPAETEAERQSLPSVP